jgi:hypothetical protein
MLLLATSSALPDLAPCDRPLVPALKALGLEPHVVAWDDASVDWGGCELCVIRTCWDYHLRREEFLGWAEGVPRLLNPLELVRWNSHKSYLRDLPTPTIPTTWLAPGESWDPCGEEVVVKPAVSASAYGAYRTRDVVVADREVLVQPYLAAVEHVGERALVFIEGEFTHAVLKAPVLAGRPEGFQRVDVTAAELELARRTLAALAEPPLYARVDLLDGMVMELEVVEPSLYLTASEAATRKLAGAIARRLS